MNTQTRVRSVSGFLHRAGYEKTFRANNFRFEDGREEWLDPRTSRHCDRAIGSALKGSNNNTAALKLEWMSPSERAAAAGDISRETLDEYGKRWISQRDLKPRRLLHYEADTGEIHFPQAGHNQHAELEACDDCAGVARSNPGGQTDSYCTRSALLRSTMHC